MIQKDIHLNMIHHCKGRRRTRILVSIKSSPRNSTIKYDENMNLSVMLISNRSGSSLFGKLVQVINDRCIQQNLAKTKKRDHVISDTVAVLVQPPITEIQILQQWASDAYYNAVISRRMGVEATLHAMTIFSFDWDVLEIGCLLLEKLCDRRDTNIQRIREHPSNAFILDILQKHAFSSTKMQQIALRVTSYPIEA
jgi:hypothetical protein